MTTRRDERWCGRVEQRGGSEEREQVRETVGLWSKNSTDSGYHFLQATGMWRRTRAPHYIG